MTLSAESLQSLATKGNKMQSLNLLSSIHKTFFDTIYKVKVNTFP